MNRANEALKAIIKMFRHIHLTGLTPVQAMATLKQRGLDLDGLRFYREAELEANDTDWDYVQTLNEAIDLLEQ